MRRLLIPLTQLLLLLAIPFVVSLSGQAAAVDVLPACDKGQPAANTDVCQNVQNKKQSDNPVIDAIKVAIEILSAIIGFAAVIMIVIGGMSFMTANGDSAAIARARTSIIYALIGLVVAGLAQVLVVFVVNRL